MQPASIRKLNIIAKLKGPFSEFRKEAADNSLVYYLKFQELLHVHAMLCPG
jgi:hypothetical protein